MKDILADKLSSTSSENAAEAFKKHSCPVAIVGIGCRMPGGIDSPRKLWDALKQGTDTKGDLSARWCQDTYYDPTGRRQGSSAARAAHLLNTVDQWDHMFFKISPREACSIDPQHRMLWEATYEACEDAGEVIEDMGTQCSVYFGMENMDYPISVTDPTLASGYLLNGTAHCVAPNRLAFFFDLGGPNASVSNGDTSAASSIHLACVSLWNREATLAVAGGANLVLLPEIHAAVSATGVLSTDGVARPFSDDANGTVRGEAVGVVCLKRLDDAIRDNNNIYAVIKGSAIYTDGKVGSTLLPSKYAMQKAMQLALNRFDTPKESIGYVEAMGTGYPIGDTLEAEALGEFYGKGRQLPVKIGSVTGQFGHAECASGIVSVMKIALMMKNGVLTPSSNFSKMRGDIDDEALKVEVLVKPELVSHDTCVALNSYSYCGTAAHIILQAPPTNEGGEQATKPTCGWRFGGQESGDKVIVPLSAKNNDALIDLAKTWSRYYSDIDALSVSGWLGARRKQHQNRISIIADSSKTFRQNLDSFIAGQGGDGLISGQASGDKLKICFVFPGQGQQWPNMGRKLYQKEPVFREYIDLCDDLWGKFSGYSVLARCGLFASREITDPESPYKTPEEAMKDSEVIQASIMMVEIALYHLYTSWGVTPDCVVGHSLGEVPSVYACGGITLEECVSIMYNRAQAQRHVEKEGKMAALRMGYDDAVKYCATQDDIHVACYNAPGNVTIGGKVETIESVAKGNPKNCKVIRVNQAYHTEHIECIRPIFNERLNGVVTSQKNMRCEYYSAVMGRYYDDEFDSEYWWKNLRQTVLFTPAVGDMMDRIQPDVFVEVGGSAVLMSCINQIGKDKGYDKKVTTVTSGRRDTDDQVSMLRALGTLYAAGVPINWSGVSRGAGEWCELPTYPWQHHGSYLEPEPRRLKRLGRTDLSMLGLDGHVSLHNFPEMTGYVLNNDAAFPPAAYLEYMFEKVKSVTNQSALTLCDVTFADVLSWPRPINLELPTGSMQLDLTYNNSALEMKYNSKQIASACCCSAAPQSPGSCDIDRAMRGCVEVASDDVYATFNDTGLTYGDEFKLIETFHRGDWVAVATIVTPTLRSSEILGTTLIDTCLQVANAAVQPCPALYLPTTIDTVKYTGLPTEDRLVVIAEIRECTGTQLVCDITVCRKDGGVVASFTGVRAVNIHRTHNQPPHTHKLMWKELADFTTGQMSPKNFIVLHDKPDKDFLPALKLVLEYGCIAHLVTDLGESFINLLTTNRKGLTILYHVTGLDNLDTLNKLTPLLTRFKHLPMKVCLINTDTNSSETAAVIGYMKSQGATLAGEVGFSVIETDGAKTQKENVTLVTEILRSNNIDNCHMTLDDYKVKVQTIEKLDAETGKCGLKWRADVSENVVDYKELQSDVLSGDEIRVAVHSVSVTTPTTVYIGNQCSGTVLEIGQNVTTLAPGDEVAAIVNGCLATEVIVNNKFAVKTSGVVGLSDAAVLPRALVTAYSCLVDRARVKRGETVLVIGAGGVVGQATLQLARGLGLTAIAAVSCDQEVTRVQPFTDKDVVNYTSPDFYEVVMTMTEGKGVNVVVDTSSSVSTLVGSTLAPFGRYCCVIEASSRQQAGTVSMKVLRGNKRLITFNMDSAIIKSPEYIQGVLATVPHLYQTHNMSPLHTQALTLTQLNTQEGVVDVTKATNISATIGCSLSHDALYIVSGSATNMAAHVIRWLANNGARNIGVIPSVSTACVRAAGSYAETKGAKVIMIAANLSTHSDHVIKTLSKTFPDMKTRGVVHVSDVTDEQPMRAADSYREHVAGLEGLIGHADWSNLDFALILTGSAMVTKGSSQPISNAVSLSLSSIATRLRANQIPATCLMYGTVNGIGRLGEDDIVEITVMDGMMDLVASGRLTDPVLCLSNKDLSGSERLCFIVPNDGVVVKETAQDEVIGNRLTEKISTMLRYNKGDVDINQPLRNYGLDLIVSQKLCEWVSEEYGIEVSYTSLLTGSTGAEIVKQIIAKQSV